MFKAHEDKVIFNAPLSSVDSTKNYTVSFWIYDFKKDLYPRSIIDIRLKDNKGNEYVTTTKCPAWILEQFNKNWTLVEFPITLLSNQDSLRISIRNENLYPDQIFIIDDLMIKSEKINVYSSDSIYISKNNRYYFKK